MFDSKLHHDLNSMMAQLIQAHFINTMAVDALATWIGMTTAAIKLEMELRLTSVTLVD